MIEWATNNGKAAGEKSVWKKTTMFKAETLPFFAMASLLDLSKDSTTRM